MKDDVMKYAKITTLIALLTLFGMFFVPEVRDFFGVGIPIPPVLPEEKGPIKPLPEGLPKPPRGLPKPQRADGVQFINFAAVTNHTPYNIPIAVCTSGSWKTKVMTPSLTGHYASKNSEIIIRWNNGKEQVEAVVPSRKVSDPYGPQTKYELRSHFIRGRNGFILLERM